MIETPQIRLSDDGSLRLSQGAVVERIVCLVLGTAALLCFFALIVEDLPANSGDALVFSLTLGFLLGALTLPSSEARFDCQRRKLSYRYERWGFAWRRQWDFAQIESLHRVECYDTAKEGLRARFFLRVDGKNWLLTPDALTLERADELEAQLRVLLPDCPVEGPPAPKIQAKAEESLPLSHRFDGSLRISPDGMLVQRLATTDRFGAIVLGVGLFSCSMLSHGAEPAATAGLALTGALLVLGSLIFSSFELRFQPAQRVLILIEEVGGFEKRQTFDFDDIWAIRRQSWLTEDHPPRELFRLFLRIGEAEEDVVLSPRDLTRAQADELQNAVQNVVGKPLQLLF